MSLRWSTVSALQAKFDGRGTGLSNICRDAMTVGKQKWVVALNHRYKI